MKLTLSVLLSFSIHTHKHADKALHLEDWRIHRNINQMKNKINWYFVSFLKCSTCFRKYFYSCLNRDQNQVQTDDLLNGKIWIVVDHTILLLLQNYRNTIKWQGQLNYVFFLLNFEQLKYIDIVLKRKSDNYILIFIIVIERIVVILNAHFGLNLE